MQPTIYRKFNEVVENYRIDGRGKREAWVRRMFEALDWGGPAAFSIADEQSGFTLQIDKRPVIKVIVASPAKIDAVYNGLNQAYNQDVPWVVTTDVESFGLFGSYWVSFRHDVSSAMALSYNFSEYLLEAQNFDLLTPQSVANNRIDEFYSAFPGRKKRLPIDIHLVERMSRWRQLACDALGCDPTTGDASVYRLINTLFLVRYMEDSTVARFDLKKLLERTAKNDFTAGLREIFS
jgi:hypothetical protein